ncbi:hypothetical protein VTO42DRAFT_8545 [Malbranchea cinnamomea]
MAQNDTELPLSELCTICHLTVPKYTCPRCYARTCSLPCAQKHKRWAQCSGVRDPTAYVKRKDLATEKGFDADYNFLSGVERSIERAGRVLEHRGLDLDGLLNIGVGGGEGGKEREGKGKRLVKGEIPFVKAAERNGVRLVRAPKGLSRRRENTSSWMRRQKCINWCIEWVLPDGTKEKTKSVETADVVGAFAKTAFARQHDRKDEDDAGQPRKKRKVETETREATVAPDELAADEPEPLIEELDDKPNAEPTDSASGGTSRTVTPEILPLLVPSQTQQPQEQVVKNKEGADSLASEQTQEPEPRSKKFHFYLHRPRSRSKFPVLIPLAGSTTLTDALRGRTVLEFPTVYVLEKELTSDGGSDAKYVLEETYLKENPEEKENNEEEESGESEDEGAVVDDNVIAGLSTLAGVDEQKVLQVLQQDLGAN